MDRIMTWLEKRYPLKFSVVQGIFMGVLKLVLALVSGLWLIAFSALYNFGIAGARGAIIKEKKNFVGWIVMLSSFLFVIYSYWIYKNGNSAEYDMRVAILIAAVTFTDIVLAVRGIIKAHKNNNNENKMISLISLATALISLTLTQTAILSFTQKGRDTSQYNGICGMIFGMVAMVIGLIILTRCKDD
ncbi:MAG: hypothetical protein K6G12_09625 [Lachnospiraceae bacterium]|nr:hypothetical protein [Lachnospiraceae bacterium]